MNDKKIILSESEYIKLLRDVTYKKIIPDQFNNDKDDKQNNHYVFQTNDDEFKINFTKSLLHPTPNIFDELTKYVTSIISRSQSVHNIYELFSNKISNELKSKNIPASDYVIYAKGGLVFRNKLLNILKYIKTPSVRNIIKKTICYDKNFCINPILNESDFDVNLIVFNPKNRFKIKNCVLKVLIEIKNEIDNNNEYQTWIRSLNKTIHTSILNSLEYKENLNSVSNVISRTSASSHHSKTFTSKSLNLKKKTIKKSINNSNYSYKYIDNSKTQKKYKNKKTNKKTNKQTKKQDNLEKFIDSEISDNELESREFDVILINNKLKFVNLVRMLEILKTIEQNKKSFYICNIPNNNFTLQSEINNFRHISDYVPDLQLKPSQAFISINDNIYMNQIKNDFKKITHFDLYRLKLNFSFYMKYANNNEFKKNIGGEVIDVSFPYFDNAYIDKNRDNYEDKLMTSKNFIGLDEFNVWGILNDLVEIIEIESLNISKPHKFENRINRFIMLRFLEYWFRIPFRINKSLNDRTFKIYNSLINSKGRNFNYFFKNTIHNDYEFERIKNILEKNQNIDIYKLYRKFLRKEPYQTLFKLSRKELDDAIGIKPYDLTSINTLINNHKKLYRCLFNISS
jgi:hypothetical protein